LRNILKALYQPQEEPTVILVDNKSTIRLAKNLVHHGRRKHIDIRFYFLRDHVKEKNRGARVLSYSRPSCRHIHKPLPADAFKKLRDKLSMTTLQV